MGEDVAGIGPLVFDYNTNDLTPESDNKCQCLMCDFEFTVSEKAEKDNYLRHLLQKHKLVIGDVALIADFQRYVQYWRERFKEVSINGFCTAIKTNSLENDPAPQELYYLLCDVLPEDKELRDKLQREKLEKVLSQQQKERNGNDFKRGCLFCRDEYKGNRAGLFNHMAEEHNFSVGKPDNLVYTDEFLEVLNEKLHSLQCLYCEKIFKDRQVLKEHMRKKGHKKINPRNTMYDKYYIVNYLEIGKNWEEIQSEVDDDNQSVQSLNDDWSDWQGEADVLAVCLFCDHRVATMDDVLDHMKDQHHFDLSSIKQDHNLSFYQQVKLVNFIRRQMYRNVCMMCQEKCVNRDDLQKHWEESGHLGRVPPVSEWDQPQYYFPTYENDNLLCGLDTEDEAVVASDQVVNALVIAEDITVQEIRDKSVLKDLLVT